MRFLDRLRRPGGELPGGADHAARQREVEDAARQIVDAAFLVLDDAEAALVEQFAGERMLSAADLNAALHRAWRDRLDEQATWADEGDYPRLVAAWARLEEAGIVARMNFTCCQTCGHAEIVEEAGDARGYTFFHQQDADGLAPGASDLYLAFGALRLDRDLDAALVDAVEGGDDDARRRAVVETEARIATEIVGALRGEGLTVEWNGSCQQRIRLVGLDWRKRLPVDIGR